MLGSGGDLQGTKLTETHTVATSTGSAAPAGSAAHPHDHDPGRNIADIQAIIQAHRDEAQACFEAGFASHPGIGGDLVMQWTIDPKGNVTHISADAARSGISEPTVLACVAGVVQKIQFAPSPGGYETKSSFPFKFRHKAKPSGGQ
jgi:hypothetical protein